MRKLLSLLVLSFLASTLALGQGHHIEFKINGLSGGDCILAHYYADQNRIVDTALVNSKGEVVFQGEEPLLNGIYLLVLPSRTYVEFVVPSEDQKFTIEFDTSLSNASKKVTGSLDNTAFLEFDLFTDEKGILKRDLNKQLEETEDESDKEAIKKQIKEVDESVSKKRKEVIAKYPGTFAAKVFNAGVDVKVPEELEGDTTGKRFEYFRQHYWDNVDLSEDGFIRTPIYFNKMKYYFTKMHVQLADSIIPIIDKLAGELEAKGAKETFKYTVWWTTKHYEDSKLMCMDRMLHHMAKNYYCAGRCFWADTSVVRKMCEHAEKIGPTLCDEVAPNLTMVDTTFAREYELHKIDYPVTILLFWDHQCGHCKKEIPKLLEMYDTMHDRGVQVYSVYTQGDWEGWKKYIKENKLVWINVMDAFSKTDFRKKYNIISTPQLLILDKDKKIRFKNAPADNVGGICEMLLKEYEDSLKAPAEGDQ